VSDLDLGIGRPRNAYRNRLIAQIAKDEGLPLPDASIMRDSVFPPPHRASFRAAVVAWLRRTARRQQAQARLERIHEHIGAREDADRARWLEENPPSVYFVGSLSLIKIGKASCVRSRMKDLQNMSAAPIVLLHTIPGGIETERALHARFADLRVHGEWFRGVDPLLSFIEGLKAVT
jgi:hypothetical protein